jgi:cell division protein FtsL
VDARKEALEAVRQQLEDNWDNLGPEYGVQGDETRLSLIARAVRMLLDERIASTPTHKDTTNDH